MTLIVEAWRRLPVVVRAVLAPRGLDRARHREGDSRGNGVVLIQWGTIMRNRLGTVVAVGMLSWGACAAADKTSVTYTIRICEGKNELKFWFNDEAQEHWNACKRPVADVPVFIVTTSGQRGEGKTGKDGIAKLPQITISPAEKFRLAMACTTHHCFSIHDLFVGSPIVKAGANFLYAESAPKLLQNP